MGYRIYLGSISNKKLKQISKIQSRAELYEIVHNKKPIDEDDVYCGAYDIVDKELHGFGKYIQWVNQLDNYSSPVFKDNEMNDYYAEDSDFFLINKDGLKFIIETINKDVEILLTINQHLYVLLEALLENTTESKATYFEYASKLKELDKSTYIQYDLDNENIFEDEKARNKKILTMVSVFKCNIDWELDEYRFGMLNLDDNNKFNITKSWFKSNVVLELAHILKTFDFKHNKLVIYGY